MASIHKRGKVYYASFKDCEGRQRQASTRTGNKWEAQHLADRLELPYHLSQVGSEAVLLHLASSLREKALDTAYELVSRFEEIDPEVKASIDNPGFSAGLARLVELIKDLCGAERYPYVKVIREASSFTGMPPESDLKIRLGLECGKRRGGGDQGLYTATRLLCELHSVETRSTLGEDPQRRIWKQAWHSLGDSILRMNIEDGRSVSDALRSAATLLSKKGLNQSFDRRPGNLEEQIFWYAACYFKRNKQVVSRKTIHSVIGTCRAKEVKASINRILAKWERVCGEIDPEFKFPETDDGDRDTFDALAEHFMTELDLKRAHILYHKL